MDIILSSATHRSGSTLLQRIFNARKKTLMWGEHKGCITEFGTIYNKVKSLYYYGKKDRDLYFRRGEDPNVWMACMTPSPDYIKKAVQESTKTFLDTLYSQYSRTHDLIGFKEVRYGKSELTLLRQCYPNAKIILLVRNPLHAWQSISPVTKQYSSIYDFAKKWNARAAYYQVLAKKDRNIYLIRYEDVIKRNPKTIKLLSKLSFVPIKEIEAILNHKVGSSAKNGKYKKKVTAYQVSIIQKVCGKTMKMYSYK